MPHSGKISCPTKRFLPLLLPCRNLRQLLSALRTTDKFEREESIYALQTMLRDELSYLDNCRVTLSIPATFGGSGAEIRCVMNGTDLEVLEQAE